MEYVYDSNEAVHTSAYLWDSVLRLIPRDARVFEIGCGNGAFNRKLRELGVDALGVDVSQSGVSFSEGSCFLGSAYDDLAARYGRFPVVISLEVVEHLFEPRRFARTAFDLLEPGGTLVVSTPYHGYWKNLALALTGRMDHHFTALWDGGHIKFWSERTLRQLLAEAGFESIDFRRVGRFGPLAKSMIAVARRPAA